MMGGIRRREEGPAKRRLKEHMKREITINPLLSVEGGRQIPKREKVRAPEQKKRSKSPLHLE